MHNNNNNTPLLSICIPTFNRRKYLQECLESILTQDGFNEQDIEIVISDNASEDDTSSLVREYMNQYSNIVYHRNEENIGAIRNIMNLPNFAHGEYIWYLSDDDMLSPIALSESLQILQNKEVDFFLCRFFGFWNGEVVNYEKLRTTGLQLQFRGVTDFFAYLGKVNYDITSYLMLLSIFCFRKSIYTENLSNLLKKNGQEHIHVLQNDNFIHATIIYSGLGETSNITLIEKDLVLTRGDNISWDFRFVVCQDLYRLMCDLRKIYHVNWRLSLKFKNIYFYAIFTYIVIVYIKKILPPVVYNFCVQCGRRILGRSK